MKRKSYQLNLPRRTLHLGPRTLVMGILNVTPDSFSDGGEFFSTDRAVEQALRMEKEGADIIDIGGESARPGARPISVEEELARVMPVITRLAGRVHIPLSIDTTKFEVARCALESGVEIINDVSGFRCEERFADLAVEFSVPLIIMHMRGTPETMQQMPFSQDILAEVADHFQWAIERAVTRGMRREQLVLDPGIGFGKTVEQNLLLIDRLDRFSQFDLPLLIGTSRKTFIGEILGKKPRERLLGTAASVVAAISRGVHIVRVHDVREIVDVVRIADAIYQAAAQHHMPNEPISR